MLQVNHSDHLGLHCRLPYRLQARIESLNESSPLCWPQNGIQFHGWRIKNTFTLSQVQRFCFQQLRSSICVKQLLTPLFCILNACPLAKCIKVLRLNAFDIYIYLKSSLDTVHQFYTSFKIKTNKQTKNRTAVEFAFISMKYVYISMESSPKC